MLAVRVKLYRTFLTIAPFILVMRMGHACFSMTQTWHANLSYAQLHTKLYVGDLTEAQGRIALKVL